MFEIKLYDKRFESAVMDLIRVEGEDWSCYWAGNSAEKYKQALATSITYVALWDGEVVGYSRALQDVFFLYDIDLLVTAEYRVHQFGKKLLEHLAADFPDLPVYILSGNDKYYSGQGLEKAGSIYRLKQQP